MLLLSLSKKILTPRPKFLSKPLWPPSRSHVDLRNLTSTYTPPGPKLTRMRYGPGYTCATIFYSKPHLCDPHVRPRNERHDPMSRPGSTQGPLSLLGCTQVEWMEPVSPGRSNAAGPKDPFDSAHAGVFTSLTSSNATTSTTTRTICNLGP